MADNPRGILVARDELAGWLDSFNQYKGGRGADVSAWLSMHRAESIRVDRRSGDKKTIYVPSAAVSITGGIQPPVLARCLGVAHFDNGLAARLLVAMPPKRPRRWTDQQITPKAKGAMEGIFARLFSLEAGTDSDGQSRPVDLALTPEAQRAWIAFYNRHGAETTALTGELAAAWSKLEGYAARLALICHLVYWAAGDDGAPGPVDEVAVGEGITLVEWFKNETRRVYATLGESDEQREQHRLVEWIERKGGSVTARDVQQGCRWLREPGKAEAALESLVKAGRGTWQPVPPTEEGGRPSRVFQLSGNTRVYETPANLDKNEGCVDVDTIETPILDSND